MNLTFLSKLSPREKKILYVVGVLLMVVFGYHGIWRPMREKFGSLDEEIFDTEMRLRKAKIFYRQRQDILEEAKKYPNLEQMEAGTDEEEIARVLNLIEQTARKAGVSLSDVKPQQVRSDKVSKSYVVELNAESEIKQLVEFIYELQYSPLLLKVEQLNTAPKQEKSTTLRSFLVVSRVVVK